MFNQDDLRGSQPMSRQLRSPRRFGPGFRCLLRGWAVACAAFFVLGGTLHAESPWPLVLFDGKSLDGWKKTDFANAGEVKVEDGSIILGVGNSMTGITTILTE